MALIVEDGTGLSTAQSLVSLAEANAILALRLHTDAWTATGMDDPKREAALAWQSRILSRLNWQGFPIKPNQALCFPRMWLARRDLVVGIPYLPGDPTYYPDDSVPQFVKEAVTVGAMRLAATDLLAPQAGLGINSIVAGPLQIDYNQGALQQLSQNYIDPEVMEIIRFALAPGGATGRIPTVRV